MKKFKILSLLYCKGYSISYQNQASRGIEIVEILMSTLSIPVQNCFEEWRPPSPHVLPIGRVHYHHERSWFTYHFKIVFCFEIIYYYCLPYQNLEISNDHEAWLMSFNSFHDNLGKYVKTESYIMQRVWNWPRLFSSTFIKKAFESDHLIKSFKMLLVAKTTALSIKKTFWFYCFYFLKIADTEM